MYESIVWDISCRLMMSGLKATYTIMNPSALVFAEQSYPSSFHAGWLVSHFHTLFVITLMSHPGVRGTEGEPAMSAES